jgi:hypothetical protein
LRSCINWFTVAWGSIYLTVSCLLLTLWRWYRPKLTLEIDQQASHISWYSTHACRKLTYQLQNKSALRKIHYAFDAAINADVRAYHQSIRWSTAQNKIRNIWKCTYWTQPTLEIRMDGVFAGLVSTPHTGTKIFRGSLVQMH